MHVAAYTLPSGLTWPAFALWRAGIVLIAGLGLIFLGVAIKVAIKMVQPLAGREHSVADMVASDNGLRT